MRRIIVALLLAGCPVACSTEATEDHAPQGGAVRGVPNDQPPDPMEDEPGEGPNEEPDAGPQPDSGPTCKDPKPVIPDGWTEFEHSAFTVGVQPGAVKIVDGPPSPDDNRWWVVAPDGEILGEDGNPKTGFVTAGSPSEGALSTLDETEDWLRKNFFLVDGKTQLTITRGSTHDCREELVATWVRPESHLEWHFVVTDGKVYSFGCEVRPLYLDVCRKFIASYDPK